MVYRINIAIFIAALLLLCVFLFALPPDPDAPRYENRSMAELPGFVAADVLSGKYTDALEAFLLDRVAYRTSFLAFSSALEGAYGLRIGGALRADIDHGDLGSGMIADPDVVYRDPSDLGMPGAVGGAAGGGLGEAGTSGGAVYGGPGADGAGGAQAPGSAHVSPNRHVNPDEPFGVDTNYDPNAVMYGDFYVDTSSVSRYIEILNEYRQSLPGNVRMYCLLVPSHVEFLHDRYNTNGASQISAIRIIYDGLDSGITAVDAYGRIAARVHDEYLYFRTDHHWTAVGAYYAYLAYAEAAGIAPVTIDNYVERALPDYIGTFGRSSQDRIVLGHPDTLYYYQLDNGTTFTQRFFYIPEDMSDLDYKLFMGGDHALLDYTSSNKNGKTLIVIKESYANAFIPWVSPNYERVVVIDPRQFEGKVGEYLKGPSPGEIDLLFLTSAFTPSLPLYVEKVAEVR